MFWSKIPWLCRFIGHKFALVKDLRRSHIKRGRVVYRCLRCNHPLIVRYPERRRIDRRKTQRRSAARSHNQDRRHWQRRKPYHPVPENIYILHS